MSEPAAIEIIATQFSHPTITSGMHTNGPATLWLKVGNEYVKAHSHHRHEVELWVEHLGMEYVVMQRSAAAREDAMR